MGDSGSKGGLMALMIGVPVMVVCCVGSLALFAGAAGAIGGWISGIGGVATLMFGVGIALFVRAWQKNQKLDEKYNRIIEHE